MFIELVDALRCPVTHEESWLVASAVRTEARHIVVGTLGCPVCSAEYPIREGVADFRGGGTPANVAAAAPGSADAAMRLAALLDLSDANGFAVLIGAWGNHASELAALTEVPLLLVDPPHGVVGAPGISVLRCDGALPIAAGAARAMAFDGPVPGRIVSAVRATRVRGRVVGSASMAVPTEVRELARDEALWVGERETPPSPLVSLHVRRS